MLSQWHIRKDSTALFGIFVYHHNYQTYRGRQSFFYLLENLLALHSCYLQHHFFESLFHVKCLQIRLVLFLWTFAPLIWISFINCSLHYIMGSGTSTGKIMNILWSRVVKGHMLPNSSSIGSFNLLVILEPGHKVGNNSILTSQPLALVPFVRVWQIFVFVFVFANTSPNIKPNTINCKLWHNMQNCVYFIDNN